MKKKFKALIEKNKWIKAVPNSLTLCNSLCGFASILITLQAYKHTGNNAAVASVFAWSAGMILFAMVFDALDGFAARILNAASMHGLQMDSLSDMVTFGVAPATLVAVMTHSMRHLDTLRQYLPVCVLCAMYLGCAALRLATYNVHAILEKKSGENFSGLPSPGAAAAICSLVLFTAIRDGKVDRLIQYLPVYAAFLGFLMISSIPYVHGAKWIISTKRNKKRLCILILILAVWFASSFFCNPLVVPVILINAYIFWGPLAALAVRLGLVKPGPDFTSAAECKETEK